MNALSPIELLEASIQREADRKSEGSRRDRLSDASEMQPRLEPECSTIGAFAEKSRQVEPLVRADPHPFAILLDLDEARFRKRNAAFDHRRDEIRASQPKIPS